MIAATYPEAMSYVYSDEGGYSNDAGDPGGPTNYGITIIDARQYWKHDASAADVRNMPKSVAADIYQKHYANPLQYDKLPPGVDYSVLDFGINSGISRSAKYLQRIVGAKDDGIIGPETIKAVNAMGAAYIIQHLNDARLAFLEGLPTWHIFGRGWGPRVVRCRKNSLAMITKYNVVPAPATTPAPAKSLMDRILGR